MSTPETQGPVDPQPSLIIPETPSVAYGGTGDSTLVTSGRAHSQPLSESSQGPSYGRRTQSESSLSIPAALTVPQYLPTLADSASEEPSSAPSPVPTEIIPTDLTQEEIVIEIQHSGIKVRDFAYEDTPPVEQRAPELFDPILAWHVYESVLDNPSPQRSPLNGRHLRRLLDIGWVSEEADGHRWRQKDRDDLEQFDARPHYPWKAHNLTKPKREDLTEVATSRFQWVNADQLGPQFISRGISRIASAFRGARHAATRYQKRLHAKDAAENEGPPPISPQLKKRRLSTSGEPEDSDSAGPSRLAASPSAHFPLALMNGRLPQQFPAGRPSGSPPRPTPLLSQGALSRSLQRHLSVSSISSPHPIDLPSDSRTTLTQE